MESLTGIELAERLQEAVERESTRHEKRHERRLARMMGDERGKVFTTLVTDRLFRCEDERRTADHLAYLLDQYGIPKYLEEGDRLKLIVFQLVGKHFPRLFVPLAKKQIFKEMSRVLLPKNPTAYFEKCRKEGVRINLNHLGEAILGEDEAVRRLKMYLDDLENPLVEYVSVKISTLYSQINPIAWEHTLEILAERLRLLYRAAQENPYVRDDGTEVEKFVNLDMEEYKDLDLTVALFKRVLDEPEFQNLSAGIVLQSYLPDSFLELQGLTEWAIERTKRGGAPIKVRLVKGANLAMEQVEASMRHWPQAPYLTKEETDANFKRMVDYALTPEHVKSVYIGMGSHNIFDIAYALTLRERLGLDAFVSFEMLQGMAEPMQRVVHRESGGMLLYSPEAQEKAFQFAVAYLIRRLDENTGPENFLRHHFELRTGSLVWEDQKKRFLAACERKGRLSTEKRRTQNRLKAPEKAPAEFQNEPDTDFSLEPNRVWAKKLLEKQNYDDIPLVICGEEIFMNLQRGIDPSTGEKLYRYALGGSSEVDRALAAARNSLSSDERCDLMRKVADSLRARRGELIHAMIGDAGKVIPEGDVEVSEAIDFCDYYAEVWKSMEAHKDLSFAPKGPILVAPPWNFSGSIPVSGIAASLLAGNPVIFKPAPETVRVGWLLAQAFWEAGVPKEALQFLNIPDDPVGNQLIQDERLAAVILTGATATAKHFLKLRPTLDLMAETGGKNALIASAMSDRDLVIRDLVLSAFGHAGQKCSACSLGILEAELYDDPTFLRQLADAAESLCVGSAWDPKTKVPPLIRPPGPELMRGLTTLEKGETWLVEPKVDPHNPNLWSPGIKLGVKEESFMHTTELFGPLLGLMRADDLNHAIEIANATPYGLTSGLHSLDEREQEVWQKKIVAGNLYINRGITGAIVRRQPFGGTKASSFGPGAKAGGPNYVAQMTRIAQKTLPQERAPLLEVLIPVIQALSHFGLSGEEQKMVKQSLENYAYWAQILKKPVDPSQILGEDNHFFHVKREKMVLRITDECKAVDFLRVIGAALVCGTPLEVSADTLAGPLPYIKENEAEFASRTKGLRVRKISEREPVLANGRFELLHYLREVSLTNTYHRYGYLGDRLLLPSE